MRTLVFGTMYVKEKEEHYINEWAGQIGFCCRNIPFTQSQFLLIDSASPEGKISQFPPHYQKFPDEDLFDFKFPQDDLGTIISFNNNIGHLVSTGKDGWGRAFCQGIKVAIDNGFDYVIHVESDMLVKVDFKTVLDFMQKNNIKVYAPKNYYNLLETGFMFMDVAYLKDTDFIHRYDWKSKKEDLPEIYIEKMLGKNYVVAWGIKGARDDSKNIPPEEIDTFQFLTHASDEMRRRFVSN